MLRYARIWSEHNVSDIYGCELFTVTAIQVIGDEPEKFNYVIARPWDESEPDRLCIYHFMSGAVCGNMEDAKRALDYVHRQPESAGKTFHIYKVNYEKID